MKEFEKQFDDCQFPDIDCDSMSCNTCIEMQKFVWKAALRWVKKKMACEVLPGDVEYFIDKELEN